MTRKTRVFLAILAIALASVTAAVVGSFPYPFYVGLFVVGPIAFMWFVVPGFLVPLLVSKLPVGRTQLWKVIAVTVLAFAASGAYLRFMPSYQGNTGAEIGIWGLWSVATALTLLAAAAYLRESRPLTYVYHLLLTTWFFALAFPYTGEFCC